MGVTDTFWENWVFDMGLRAEIMTGIGQIKTVNRLKYLGPILESDSTTTLEIGKRISVGRKVICMLNSVLWNKNILYKTKDVIYQALFQSILLYGAQTWTLNIQYVSEVPGLCV
jgi:hypothetical protein